MKFVKSLVKSFYFAFRGLGYVIRTQRNFRIHLTAIIYVLLFALFYGLSGSEAAILVLTFFTVPALELVNTSIENTVDIKTREVNPNARKAKDIAAAAVLFASMTAVAVAFCMFSDTERLAYAFITLITPPWLIIILISLIPAFFFVRGKKY